MLTVGSVAERVPSRYALLRYLRKEVSSTVLVVSHDRAFLNEVVTDIVVMERGGLEIFRGDYLSFCTSS